jgi:hypothetical protein
MPLLAELFALLLPNYKYFAPTERVIRSIESGDKTRVSFFKLGEHWTLL